LEGSRHKILISRMVIDI